MHRLNTLRTALVIGVAMGALPACHVAPRVSSVEQLGSVITLDELHANRAALDGHVVRVVGFLTEEQQTFDLVKGRMVSHDTNRISCLNIDGIEHLWVDKDDLRRAWWFIRPRDRASGIQVVLEGEFHNEIVPRFNPDGTANETIWMGLDDAPLNPTEYHGMGPLREARVIAILPGRCSYAYG